ncbi:MAG: hypothetical protein HOP32_16375 [Nitrospira sp.]|nr:hypothetical protein [Nitrospira sp.]
MRAQMRTTGTYIEWSLSTSSGFPPFLTGLGRFVKAALDRCVVCRDITCFAYGVTPLCCAHARQHYKAAMTKEQE